jgi:hypothetical protein
MLLCKTPVFVEEVPIFCAVIIGGFTSSKVISEKCKDRISCINGVNPNRIVEKGASRGGG